jgi:hypothetical protein
VAIERAGMMADRLMADMSLLNVVAPSVSERALEQDLQHAIARVLASGTPVVVAGTLTEGDRQGRLAGEPHHRDDR